MSSTTSSELRQCSVFPATRLKAYIGQGLRVDLERLEGGIEIPALIESLRSKGVADEIISSALAEAQNVILNERSE
jgi:hypothetical protein